LERSDASKIAGCVSGFGELIPQKNMGLSLKASRHRKHSRSKVQQALWPLHPDHPANDPATSEEDCEFMSPNLVCPG